jgi:hypothetical protein
VWEYQGTVGTRKLNNKDFKIIEKKRRGAGRRGYVARKKTCCGLGGTHETALV